MSETPRTRPDQQMFGFAVIAAIAMGPVAYATKKLNETAAELGHFNSCDAIVNYCKAQIEQVGLTDPKAKTALSPATREISTCINTHLPYVNTHLKSQGQPALKCSFPE